MSRRTPALSLLLATCVAALFAGVARQAAAGDKTVLMGGDTEAEAAPRRPRRMVTDLDEKRAGRAGARQVAKQMGLLDDAALDAYLQRIGDRLLKAVPRRSFEYSFRVVDQTEPNAFALPGGFIFVSRGLLALANSEDEVANVVGHEIAHVVLRHSVRQQSIQRSQSALLFVYMRYAQLAAYGRDMEREADEEGQKLAAAAGYDPRAMAAFMETLGRWTELETGQRRQANWFDSHPTTGERAAVNAIRASELRWKRDPALGDTHARHLRAVEGMPVGQRPAAGLFAGDRFLHPDLDFQLRFPSGWRLSNTPVAVGAQAREGSVVFLSSDVPEGKPRTAAEKFVEKNAELRVRTSQPDRIRGQEVWRLEAGIPGGHAYLVFLEHASHTFALVGMVPSFAADRDRREVDRTMRSFRRLTPDQVKALHSEHLKLVEAKASEGLPALSKRTGNAWGQGQTAVSNGVEWSHTFEGGELVKVVESKPYRPGR